jgi:excisionase family DNA binding protein
MWMIDNDVSPSATLVSRLKARTAYLSGSEVMSLLGVSRNALCRWVRTGKLPAIRIGKDNRFAPLQLAGWIEACQM